VADDEVAKSGEEQVDQRQQIRNDFLKNNFKVCLSTMFWKGRRREKEGTILNSVLRSSNLLCANQKTGLIDVFALGQYNIRTIDLLSLCIQMPNFISIEKHDTRVLSKTADIMRNHLNLAAAIEHPELSGINSISNFGSKLPTVIVFRWLGPGCSVCGRGGGGGAG
jgi:hypothetical protein